MGNTKTYYFEGETLQKFTKQELLEQAHGTYACIEWDEKGYLESEEEKPAGQRLLWFCAALHSHSIGADSAVSWLAARCVQLRVMRGDWDWSDCRTAIYDHGLVVAFGAHSPIVNDIDASSNAGGASTDKNPELKP